MRQVSGANTKAIFVSNNSLQKSAFKFATSKGIGFLRIFDDSNFKWELHRKDGSVNFSSLSKEEILLGILEEHYVSNLFKYFALLKDETTNNLLNLYRVLTDIEDNKIFKSIIPAKNTVPYVDDEELEELAKYFLIESGYTGGKVMINSLYKILRRDYHYRIIRNYPRPSYKIYNDALGRVIFNDKRFIYLITLIYPPRGNVLR